MSRPVNVLAVLDVAIDRAVLVPELAEDLKQVRAAVADLIDVLDVAAYGEYLPESVEQELRVALAEARGTA